MRIVTESGSVYELSMDGSQVRRLVNEYPVDPNAETHRASMRQDGEWLKLFRPVEPVLGLRMFLMIEPLSEEASVTVRETTVVVGIEP